MSHRASSARAALAAALALATISGCERYSEGGPWPAPEPPAKQQEQAPTPASGPGSAASRTPQDVDVAALVERVAPSVVNITTTENVTMRGSDPFDALFGDRGQRQLRRMGAGTGFIIDASGLVVTNAHVVQNGAELRVRLADDRELDAEVVGRDPRLDLALLRLKGAKDLPVVSLGSSERLRVGEPVVAIGNPFGLGHTVTFGIVSAKARSIGAGPYDDFIQTDASINPGNSGGPLFNASGEVVGINTAIRTGGQGIGFATPIDAFSQILPQLRDTGHVERGMLGVIIQPLSDRLAKALQLDSTRGALIAEIDATGAAGRAGIEAGDVVVAVNGKELQNAAELPRTIATHRPKDRVTLSVVRDGKRRDVEVTLDALPDPTRRRSEHRPVAPAASSAGEGGRLGVKVSDAYDGGARVDEIVDPRRAADLVPGDVVVALQGRSVADAASLRDQLATLQPGALALLKLRRGDGTQFAAIELAAR